MPLYFSSLLDIVKNGSAYWEDFSCTFVSETIFSGHGGLGTYRSICEALTNEATQTICCSFGVHSYIPHSRVQLYILGALGLLSTLMQLW
jgi:hypothetical protein